MMNKEDVLREMIEPVVAGSGLELFEFKTGLIRGTCRIDLLVDKPSGGISVDECARVNHEIVRILDEKGIYGSDYTVSVSSPGLDRPLKEVKDFLRVLGYEVEIQFELDGQVNRQTGVLRSADENTVVLGVKQGEVSVPFAGIHKAVLMF